MSLSERMKAVLERRGITQAELAVLLETSESQVSRIISEKQDPRLSTAQRIHDALDRLEQAHV